jgi:hypothetical protein
MLMSFVKDNKAYEKWLASQCKVVWPDIDYKHHRMEKSAFIFLRATYFRWARKIGDWCPELMNAPQVRAVGDLHLENFGTWRDRDGRLVWALMISTKPPKCRLCSTWFVSSPVSSSRPTSPAR